MFIPRSIGLLAGQGRPDLQEVISRMRKELSERGLDSFLIEDKAWFDDDGSHADLIITFGGDGTMLSASSLAARKGIPLAGVNVGRLGFLTSCSVNQMNCLVAALAEGTCLVDSRDMLQAQRIRENGEEAGERKLGLNEVTLMRSETGKMVDLDAVVDGLLLNRYHADGVVVATPTGSSAYSLSAGGPLVWPGSDVICVTPVCPHSLTNRAVVLPNHSVIELRPRSRRGRSGEMRYSLDGRDTYPIEVGDCLLIRRAPEKMKLIHLPGFHFAELLRAKLRWQGAELP